MERTVDLTVFPALNAERVFRRKRCRDDHDVTKKIKPEPTAEELAAKELVRRAREQGLSLTGPDGLLKQLTRTVLETAVSHEMTEHLGHDKNGRADPEHGNVRNGTRPKTVLTEATGQVQTDVPRDRAGTFGPQIVKKRQRRLAGVDEIVRSLYAKGLTTGEISGHFAQIHGASVPEETISRVTDKAIEEMRAWQARPLDGVYAAIFIDAIVVKVRDGQVANRPVYAAIGISLAGERRHRGAARHRRGRPGRHRRRPAHSRHHRGQRALQRPHLTPARATDPPHPPRPTRTARVHRP